MPLRRSDPFYDRTDLLKEGVNPYVARLKQCSDNGDLPVWHGETLRTMPGRWRDRLATYHGRPEHDRLIVEVGCHKGRVFNNMAKDFPDQDFLGIDITFKRVIMTAERSQRRGLKNTGTIMANGATLEQLFAPGELDGLIVFFPDPWVKKKRQAKHRLVNLDFAQQCMQLIKPGGFFWLKTDQAVYHHQAAHSLAAAGFVKETNPQGLIASKYLSTFEEKFSRQDLPTYELILRRPRDFPAELLWEKSDRIELAPWVRYNNSNSLVDRA